MAGELDDVVSSATIKRSDFKLCSDSYILLAHMFCAYPCFGYLCITTVSWQYEEKEKEYCDEVYKVKYALPYFVILSYLFLSSSLPYHSVYTYRSRL